MIAKTPFPLFAFALFALAGCADTNVTCASPGAIQRLTGLVENFFKKTDLIGADSKLTFSGFITRDIDSVHSDCTVLASGMTSEGEHRAIFLQYMVRNTTAGNMVVDPDFGSIEIKRD